MAQRRDLDLKPPRKMWVANPSPPTVRRERSQRLLMILGLACLVIIVGALAVANLVPR